jgi:hypothetical protein
MVSRRSDIVLHNLAKVDRKIPRSADNGRLRGYYAYLRRQEKTQLRQQQFERDYHFNQLVLTGLYAFGGVI